MQYNENKFIHASELSSYYMCPRLVFFQRRRAHEITDQGVRAGFFKALSHELSSVALSQRPEASFDEAVSRACADSLSIYGAPFEHVIAEAGQGARGLSEKIIAGLGQEKAKSGEQELMNVLCPASIGITVYSDRLRISGTIDKVVMHGGIPAPVIISASCPPETGVYASDRVRLAAYAMLLSEKYDVPCASGAIEYVPGWRLRRAEIRYDDKRKALYARNRVLEMDKGRMPEASRGKWCASCGHDSACSVKPSLLSSIFR